MVNENEEIDEKYDYNPMATQSPSDAVIDYVARRQRVIDEDDVIGLCSECKSEMPHDYMVRNIFAKEGVPVPCKYCGGIVVITYREWVNESLLNSLDTNRGIGFG